MPASSSVPFMPNLIYDVGMHSGQDTEFYLKKGFDVVGFEANPALCEQNRQTFAPYIESGRLRIVEGAIVPDPSVGHITFYTYEERSKWGTIMTDVVQSSEKRATGVVELKVPTVDFAAVIAETGMPYFLKIDIEGADIHCLDVLRQFDARPAYLSIEAIEQDIERQRQQIDRLTGLGYDAFKAVQQARMHRRTLPAESREGSNVTHRFPKGSSGPFGSDLGGEWRSSAEILEEYDAIFRRNRRLTESLFWKYAPIRKHARALLEWTANITVPGWYDTHARHCTYKPD